MGRAAALLWLLFCFGCAKESAPPDPCVLLRAAKPEALLATALGDDRRIYGLCRIDSLAAPAGPDEKSVGLEIRRDAEAAAVANAEQFWGHEGNGVGYQGGVRENLRELNGPGSFTVWVPIEGGLQLFSYWDRENLLVISIKGAPVERALPWAQTLAGETVRAERASGS